MEIPLIIAEKRKGGDRRKGERRSYWDVQKRGDQREYGFGNRRNNYSPRRKV